VRDGKGISPNLFCDFCLPLTISEISGIFIVTDFHRHFKPHSKAIKFHISFSENIFLNKIKKAVGIKIPWCLEWCMVDMYKQSWPKVCGHPSGLITGSSLKAIFFNLFQTRTAGKNFVNACPN